MSRIDSTFSQLKAAGRKALIPYVTAGDPYADATVEIMQALADGGVRSLVAHGGLSDFRAFIGHVGTAAHGCTLAAGEAMAMGIGIGDEVRHVGF